MVLASSYTSLVNMKYERSLRVQTTINAREHYITFSTDVLVATRFSQQILKFILLKNYYVNAKWSKKQTLAHSLTPTLTMGMHEKKKYQDHEHMYHWSYIKGLHISFIYCT